METIKNRFLALLFVAVLAVGTCAFAGCSSSSDNASNNEPDTEAVEEDVSDVTPAMTVYGEQTDTAKSIVLENDLGGDITDIAVEGADDAEFPAGLITDGSTWVQGQQVQIYFESDQSTQNVQIVTADATYELHGVDLSAIANAKVMQQDGVAYLSYEQDGQTQTTLAAEQALIQQQKDAEAAAAAQAEAEKQAAAQQEEQSSSSSKSSSSSSNSYSGKSSSSNSSSSNQSKSGSSSSSSSSSTGSGSSSSSSGSSSSSSSGVSGQSSDSCVEGGVVLR